jgi:3-phenylpropionate/trans-cinnamate dioxygenase ferredoxin reductase subunit
LSDQIIIVGGSHAAISVADNLRKQSFDGPIKIINAEDELPYQRPPLSKAYMSGDMTLDRLHLRPAEWYADNNIDLVLSTRATAIHRDTKQLEIEGGALIAYDKLVLATGASARKLPAAIGGELDNVHVMRDLRDANILMEKMTAGKKLVVIGGGYIGLEAAAEASKKGLSVTVLEAAPRILQRVASPETADAFRALHEKHGVKVLENVVLKHIKDNGNGACAGVVLEDDTIIDADIIITGIGILPNMELAVAAELKTGLGIIVDEYGRTSDADIYACGDVTVLPFEGQPTRLESVQNAHDQGAIVASNIAGANEAYHPEPWFWSDQYDMKLQIAGLNRGYDNVVIRQGKREGSVSHFYFSGDKFIAVDCMNDAATYAMSKRILASNAQLTIEMVLDQEFALKSLLV